jgi:ABC-2 type transport system permease protein
VARLDKVNPGLEPIGCARIQSAAGLDVFVAVLACRAGCVPASQILVVFIFMFSPLNFPSDRLPGWLAAIHNVLPIQAMGEVMRGTLASNSFPITFGAFALLGVWCCASFVATSLVLTRRA